MDVLKVQMSIFQHRPVDPKTHEIIDVPVISPFISLSSIRPKKTGRQKDQAYHPPRYTLLSVSWWRKKLVSPHPYTGIRGIRGADHWKTAEVLQSSENSLYTHIRKLALAPPKKINRWLINYIFWGCLQFLQIIFITLVPNFNQFIYLWTPPNS